jgi:hypothetical protein
LFAIYKERATIISRGPQWTLPNLRLRAKCVLWGQKAAAAAAAAAVTVTAAERASA